MTHIDYVIIHFKWTKVKLDKEQNRIDLIRDKLFNFLCIYAGCPKMFVGVSLPHSF